MKIRKSAIIGFLLICFVVYIEGTGYTIIRSNVVVMFAWMFLLFASRFITDKKSRIYREDTICWLFLLYLIVNAVFLTSSFVMSAFIFYVIPLVTSIMYVFTDNSSDSTEKLFNCIRVIALIEMVTVFISVAYKDFIPKTLGFLYPPGRLLTVNKELRRGIYSGYLAEKAQAAYIMCIGLAVNLSRLRDEYGRINKRMAIEAILLFAAIMMTGKRMLLLIAFVFVLLAILHNQSRTVILSTIGTLALIAIGIAVLVYFVPAAAVTFDRFLNTENYSTIGGRETMWKWALQMFRQKPIFGYGYGTYQSVSGMPYNAHNGYLQILAEMGIVGMILFMLILLPALIRAFFNLKHEHSSKNYLVLFILLLTMLYAVTGNVFHEYSQQLPLFMALSMQKQKRREEDLLLATLEDEDDEYDEDDEEDEEDEDNEEDEDAVPDGGIL